MVRSTELLLLTENYTITSRNTVWFNTLGVLHFNSFENKLSNMKYSS